MAERKQSIASQLQQKLDANLTSAGIDPAVEGATGANPMVPRAASVDSQPPPVATEAPLVPPPAVPPPASGDAAVPKGGSEPAAPPPSSPAAVLNAPKADAVAAPPVVAVAPEQEWEDAEIEEGPGVSYAVKVPKGKKNEVLGYSMRRADYDRKLGALGKHRPILEPLIADGRMDAFAPLIVAATQNEQFSNAVANLYYNFQNGLPLYQGLAPEAAPQQNGPSAYSGQPQSAPTAQASNFDQFMASIDQEETDPYVAAAMKRTVGPLLNEIQRLTQGYNQIEQQTQARNQQAQAQQQNQQNVVRENTAIEAQFRQAYPEVFRAEPQAYYKYMNDLERYAVENGFTNGVGRAGGMFAAKRYLDNMTAPTTANMATSAAAQSMADVEAAAQRAAAAASGQVAGGIAGGNASSPSTPPAPPKKIATRDKDGKPRNMRDVVAESMAQVRNAS